MSPDSEITLREVTSDNVRAVCGLAVTSDQGQFVAPNALSMAEYAVTTKAWTRAVYADEEPVGYVLLSDDDEQPRYYLWRYTIDQRYQDPRVRAPGDGAGHRLRPGPPRRRWPLCLVRAGGRQPGELLQEPRLRRHRQVDRVNNLPAQYS